MTHRIKALSLVAMAALALGCAQAPPPSADEAWSEFRSAYGELETAAEKTALAEEFLAQHPGSEHSGTLASIIAWYRGHEMDDQAGAYRIIAGALPTVEDPEQRFEVQMQLIPLAIELGEEHDLAAAAAALAEHRPLSFSEHMDVTELAVEHELWPVAEAHSAMALELATPEAFLADYPDDEYSLDEAAEKAARRRVMALAHQGWALANSERHDEALELFAAAAKDSQVNYLGVPDTRLYEFWGRTALLAGDNEKAMELLGPDAVFGDNDAALEAYREAFAAHDPDADVEQHLWAAREAMAKQIDDFTLAAYDGTEVTLSELGQGKVLLLAFWFPT